MGLFTRRPSGTRARPVGHPPRPAALLPESSGCYQIGQSARLAGTPRGFAMTAIRLASLAVGSLLVSASGSIALRVVGSGNSGGFPAQGTATFPSQVPAPAPGEMPAPSGGV